MLDKWFEPSIKFSLNIGQKKYYQQKKIVNRTGTLKFKMKILWGPPRVYTGPLSGHADWQFRKGAVTYTIPGHIPLTWWGSFCKKTLGCGCGNLQAGVYRNLEATF